MHVQCTCSVCGSPFLRSPSQVKRAARPVCSKTCAALNLRARVDLTCDQCGSPFTVIRKRAKRAKYCSLSCRNIGIRLPRNPLEISKDGATAIVPLYRGDGSVRDYALIDADDAILVSQHRWYKNNGYAVTMVERRTVRLHRLLLGLFKADELECDHINRDKLDNRRQNLRRISKDGNKQNVPSQKGSSIYRGVSRHTDGKWQAQIQVGGKLHYLGLFVSEIDAADAARLARQRLMPYAVD